MSDHVSPDRRSFIMSRVKTEGTGPELMLRRELHKLGYRYRLNMKTLPGKPDLVFPKRRKIIFVHGCFWHGHGCKWGRLPKSRLDYWQPKITANRNRDSRNITALVEAGWEVLVVWQCQLRKMNQCLEDVCSFLDRQGETA